MSQSDANGGNKIGIEGDETMDEDVQAVRRIGGAVDDVVITGDTFHLERMDDDAWWAGIYRGDRCVSLWIACEAGRIDVEVTNDELGCIDDTSGPVALGALPPPSDRPVRRGRKTPAELAADLIQLLEQFRRQHDTNPADVTQDDFDALRELLAGFRWHPPANSTEPVEEQPPDAAAAERTP